MTMVTPKNGDITGNNHGNLIEDIGLSRSFKGKRELHHTGLSWVACRSLEDLLEVLRAWKVTHVAMQKYKVSKIKLHRVK